MADATPPAGQGTPAPEGEKQAPQFVTAEQLNAAIGSHLKRLKIPGTDEIKAAAIEAFKAAREAERDAGDPPPKADGKKTGADSAELLTLRRDLDAMKKTVAAREQENAEIKAANQLKGDNDAVRGVLEAAQITGPRARHALSYLRAEGFIRREGDELKFVKGDELVSIHDGIESFLKTDDGKHFLPASGAQGTGARTPGTAAQKAADQRTSLINDFLTGRGGG
jgi:hypothetical protein